MKPSVLWAAILTISVVDWASQLRAVQLEVGKQLLGAPKSSSSVHIRAALGWRLLWDEEVALDVAFTRAELDLRAAGVLRGELAGSAWAIAQKWPAHTWATESGMVLERYGIPGFHDSQLACTVDGLEAYKRQISAELEARSRRRWAQRASARSVPAGGTLLTLPGFPLEVGALFEMGASDHTVLSKVRTWQRTRLGFIPHRHTGKCCLCQQEVPSSTKWQHLVNSCRALTGPRERYRRIVAEHGADPGARHVFSLYRGPQALAAGIVFGAAIGEALTAAACPPCKQQSC